MQAGFSLMETGLVRSKNATNILMKSTLDACEFASEFIFNGVLTDPFLFKVIGATVYWLVGYAFAFGDGNEFIGWTGFALQGVSPSKLSFWFYQTIFANTASTIVRYGHPLTRDLITHEKMNSFCLFVFLAVRQLKELTCLRSSFTPFYSPDSFIRLPVAGSGIHPDGSKSEVLSISAAAVAFTCLVAFALW